jgi:hypothetical protein
MHCQFQGVNHPPSALPPPPPRRPPSGVLDDPCFQNCRLSLDLSEFVYRAFAPHSIDLLHVRCVAPHRCVAVVCGWARRDAKSYSTGVPQRLSPPPPPGLLTHRFTHPLANTHSRECARLVRICRVSVVWCGGRVVDDVSLTLCRCRWRAAVVVVAVLSLLVVLLFLRRCRRGRHRRCWRLVVVVGVLQLLFCRCSLYSYLCDDVFVVVIVAVVVDVLSLSLSCFIRWAT